MQSHSRYCYGYKFYTAFVPVRRVLHLHFINAFLSTFSVNRADTEEVRANRIFYLLDTYLNTSDKFQNETALHFAAKFGCVDIVELLVSFPECDRERKNTQGLTPAEA